MTEFKGVGVRSEEPRESPQTRVWAFGVFRFDAASLELTRAGRPLPLAPLPAQALALLLARAGEVVSQEALVEHLWGKETFVDAAAGLHTAIRQIRRALGDAAASSRFVETLPRRGYRFAAPVETLSPSARSTAAPRSRRTAWLVGGAAAALALALAMSWALPRPPAPSAQPAAAPGHPAALDAYFKGRFILDSPGTDNGERARPFFERALRLDPNHAPSWLGIAQARLRSASRTGATGSFEAARAAADRAIGLASELGPGLGRAWAARAQARWLATWDWEGGRADYARALELAPEDADVHLAYAFFAAACGEHDAAVHHALEARRLGPLDPGPNLDLAWIYVYSRQWDQVVAESLHALALEPDLFTAHYTLAMAYDRLGDEPQAEEAYLRMWKAAGAPGTGVEAARTMPADERRDRMLTWWTDGDGAAHLPAFDRALIEFSRGSDAAGWAALAESVQRREFAARMLAVDPRLDGLRDEPAFQSLLAAIGRS